MYERLSALYSTGKIDAAALDNAVAKGWITKKQAKTIKEG